MSQVTRHPSTGSPARPAEVLRGEAAGRAGSLAKESRAKSRDKSQVGVYQRRFTIPQPRYALRPPAPYKSLRDSTGPAGRAGTTPYAARAFFITGTDTGVGKSVVTLALGLLIKEKGFNVGVMKPIQCAGNDAAFLKKALGIKDPLSEINPFCASEPLSPHMAFARDRKKIYIEKIFKTYEKLKSKHDILLIEGAGGLMVPITENYFVADLIRDMRADVIVVARLGLGTINHSLLTINQLRELGVSIKGIIFSQLQKKANGIPEKTNPGVIQKIGAVPILGIMPYFESLESKTILKKCKKQIKIEALLNEKRESRSQELGEWDKKYLWHPFTQMKDWLEGQPLVIDRAEGNYLIDTEGRRFLDGVSSLWVNLHGHRKKEMDEALKHQLNKLSHSTLLGLSNTPAIELAKRLIEIAPKGGRDPSTSLRAWPSNGGLAKVFYSDNGSTAVEVAIKMAYQYWQNTGRTQKTQLVHLSNSYHGDTLGSVSLGGIDLFHQVYKKLMIKTIGVEFPDFYRAPEGKIYPQYTEECLGGLKYLFETTGGTIAAVVVEPMVQGAAGMIVWPPGILKRIRELCSRYDIFLICDEVATGFGRTGKMFACEHEGVTPDFLCLAKGITAGYLPLAATLTSKKVFDGFLFDKQNGDRPLFQGSVPFQKTFFHGHTYTGNPLACAAALASLEIFEKEKVLARLQPKIKFLADKLKMFYNLPHVGDVRQKGFMVGIELVRDRQTKEPFVWEERIGVKVCQKVRERGVILRPLGNVIVLMPPLSITLDELEKLLEVTRWSIQEITEESEKLRKST